MLAQERNQLHSVASAAGGPTQSTEQESTSTGQQVQAFPRETQPRSGSSSSTAPVATQEKERPPAGCRPRTTSARQGGRVRSATAVDSARGKYSKGAIVLRENHETVMFVISKNCSRLTARVRRGAPQGVACCGLVPTASVPRSYRTPYEEQESVTCLSAFVGSSEGHQRCGGPGQTASACDGDDHIAWSSSSGRITLAATRSGQPQRGASSREVQLFDASGHVRACNSPSEPVQIEPCPKNHGRPCSHRTASEHIGVNRLRHP